MKMIGIKISGSISYFRAYDVNNYAFNGVTFDPGFGTYSNYVIPSSGGPFNASESASAPTGTIRFDHCIQASGSPAATDPVIESGDLRLPEATPGSAGGLMINGLNFGGLIISALQMNSLNIPGTINLSVGPSGQITFGSTMITPDNCSYNNLASSLNQIKADIKAARNEVARKV